MPLPWFRLYSEFIDDPKVQMIPENMRYRLVALMCSRCKDEVVDDALLAHRWRVPLSEVQETKALFIDKGFIEKNWTLKNWTKRQYVSDSSANRVRKHRNVTVSGRYKGVTVTSPDTDTDTEYPAGLRDVLSH